jgi:hypothetical protein
MTTRTYLMLLVVCAGLTAAAGTVQADDSTSLQCPASQAPEVSHPISAL